jgi:hypothetical protein
VGGLTVSLWLKNDFKPGSKIPHEWLNTIANFWNGLAVSESDTTGIQRQSDGRNTTILAGSAAKINDSEGYDTEKNPDGRMTIETNVEDYSGEADSHLGEWQLRNVSLVKRGSSSIPFFVSETDLQGSVPDRIVGELYWGQIDAHRIVLAGSPSYKSLSVSDDYVSGKGQRNFGLYSFPSSATCTAPYSIHSDRGGITDKTLTWQVPVMLESDPRATTAGTVDMATAISGGTGGVGYATATFSKRTFTIDKGALNIGAAGGGSTIQLPITIDAEALGNNLGHDQLTWFNGGTPSWSGSCTDHDPRYLCLRGTGRESWASGNTTSQIAYDHHGKFGIDFGVGQLMREDGGGAAVDYKNSYLYTNAGTKMVDWALGIIYKPALAGGWVTDNNCGFSVGSGGNFEVYSGKTTLTCTTGTDALKLTTGATGSPTVQLHATAESSVPVTYLDNIRLMIGHSTSTWIGFEATAGQLLIKDNTGAELAKFTLGDPG